MADDRFDAEKKPGDASAPYNTYDSLLEVPRGDNFNQNAWLTLKLHINLNFVDSTHPAIVDPGVNRLPLLNQKADGKWYATDSQGYQYPAQDWPAYYKEKFKTEFQRHAEKVWNFQFLLITPTNYSGLDIMDKSGNWVIRPNVLCLFRLEFAVANVHRTINVVNLDFRTANVTNVDPSKAARAINKPFDAKTFGSDEFNYDDSDLFRPYMLNPAKKVWHDTIGHEIGHALGQAHILPLKGDLTCTTPQDGTNARPCYGITEVDQFNIMGKGDKIYLLNAVSWRERIAVHTFRQTTNHTLPAEWGVTGQLNTPPRKIALGASLIGTPNF